MDISDGCGLPLYVVHTGRGRSLSCFPLAVTVHKNVAAERVSFAFGRKFYSLVHIVSIEHRYARTGQR